MKYFVIAIWLSLVFSLSLTAQYYSVSGLKNNFERSVKNVEQAYSNQDKGRGTGYKQFKRWEEFVQKRLNVNGNRVNGTALSFAAYNKLKKSGATRGDRSSGYWLELGPSAWSNNPDPYPDTDQGGWGPGNGRINEIAFHPTNPNIIYAGASGGGLWKTSDGGTTWTSLTDGMPNLAISGIAVSHTNPDVIYILTGDGDSEDLASIGVLETTDDGENWFQTGLVFERDEVVFGTELKMNPSNSNILIATTSNGIYRTSNGGDSWTLTEAGSFFDVEYNPSNADTVYASTSDTIYRSSDGGANWSMVEDLSAYIVADGKSRIELAVTPDNANKVYALLGDNIRYLGVFISADRGTSWVRHFDDMGPNILNGEADGSGNKTQAIYDLAIEVSPINEERIFVGSINIWRSFDGGDHWVITSHWRQDWDEYEYVHADIHELIYNGTTLFAGCDGGIFKTITSGLVWIDISEGLGIMQPHKIGITNSNTNLVYMGAQDNGVNRYSGSATVDNVRGADGFECIIMPTNSDTVISSRQYGNLELSSDGGNTFSPIFGMANGKVFNNPLLLRPIVHNRLIVSLTSSVRVKTLSGAMSFQKYLPTVELHNINNLDISQTDEDLLIASTIGRIDVSQNIDTKDSLWLTETFFDISQDVWTNITSNLPVERHSISDIVIDPSNNHHFIVSFSGYTDGNKVFESWNRGVDWTNVSYNLENIPVNCIAVDPDVVNSIYIGTDIGVFYKVPASTEWTYYSNGLPPVIIQELEINTQDDIIYAATYGRGLWKSTLFADCQNLFILTPSNDPGNPNYTGMQVYEASDHITSTRIITGGYGTDVLYKAQNYVVLTPGFVAKQGNLFRATIGTCGQAMNGKKKTTKNDKTEIDK